MAAKMVRVLNTHSSGVGINSLPVKDKDGKPNLTTVQYFDLPAQTLDSAGKPVPGACDIPEDLWKELAAKDDFVRGHLDARRLVVEEADSAPAPKADADDKVKSGK